jgi:hypothetical protein
MTTPGEDTERKVPSRRYRITQDRWCWCGRAAALIVTTARGNAVIEPVCSEEHGMQVIRWIEMGVVPYDKGTIANRVAT